MRLILIAACVVVVVVASWLGIRRTFVRPEGEAAIPGVHPKSKVDTSGDRRAWLSGWATFEANVGLASEYPQRIQRTKDRMWMVLVPAGKFMMGRVPNDPTAAMSEEPRHEVTISRPYYMDEHEVTVAMWREYARALQMPMKSLAKGITEECPMTNLTWTEVQGYAAWVGATLPTEAQWERAARGGIDGLVYPWGDADDVSLRNGPPTYSDGDFRNDDGYDFSAPVRAFPPNLYGIYGASGNGSEWCEDYLDAYGDGPVVDPRGPDTRRRERVIRSNEFPDIGLRSSYRSGAPPNADVAGVRCVRVVVEQHAKYDPPQVK